MTPSNRLYNESLRINWPMVPSPCFSLLDRLSKFEVASGKFFASAGSFHELADAALPRIDLVREVSR